MTYVVEVIMCEAKKMSVVWKWLSAPEYATAWAANTNSISDNGLTFSYNAKLSIQTQAVGWH
jgi:hypothetical protein